MGRTVRYCARIKAPSAWDLLMLEAPIESTTDW